MTIAEKLTTIAENEQKVYNKGLEDGKALGGDGVDWDIIQNYGNRTVYSSGFAYWAIKHLSPKYIVKPYTTTFSNAIQGCTELETVDWKKFDLSQVTSFYVSFNSCFKLKSIGIDLIPAATYASCWNNTFSNCWELKNIQRVKSFPEHTWLNTFMKCYELEEIRFTEDSEIANNISFADSPKLSKESIVSICNALGNVEGKTLTFSTDLGLEDKLREIKFGLGTVPFGDGEEKTENGITFKTDDNHILTVNGTATGTASYEFLNEPIKFSAEYADEYVVVSIADMGNVFNSHLIVSVKRANGGTEYIDGGLEFYMYDGDKIESICLYIYEGENWESISCVPAVQFNYWEWAINEPSNYRGNWNIIY